MREGAGIAHLYDIARTVAIEEEEEKKVSHHNYVKSALSFKSPYFPQKHGIKGRDTYTLQEVALHHRSIHLAGAALVRR